LAVQKADTSYCAFRRAWDDFGFSS